MDTSNDNKSNQSLRVLDNHPLKRARDYVRKEQKEHLQSFANLSYDRYELKELGILRPVIKQMNVEIACRANSEITHRLRNPEEVANLRTVDLIGIASIATKHLLELEAITEREKEIDWSKFDSTKFDSPSTNTTTGSNQP